MNGAWATLPITFNVPESPETVFTASGIIMIPVREVGFMANVFVRNLDDDVLNQLKAAAKAHGRSLQAEIHDVLRHASARRVAETQRLSAKWLKRLRGSRHSDSTALIRDDREAR